MAAVPAALPTWRRRGLLFRGPGARGAACGDLRPLPPTRRLRRGGGAAAGSAADWGGPGWRRVVWSVVGRGLTEHVEPRCGVTGGGGGWRRAECRAVVIVLCSAAGCELKAEKEYQFKVDDEENEHQLSLRTVSTVCSSVARSEFSCCQKGSASCEFISSHWISVVTSLFLQIFSTISSTCWELNVWFCLLYPSVSNDTLWLITSNTS